LFARHYNGVFVLRIEDTDRKRATEEAYRAVLEDMRWLGLEWDEGPEGGGRFGPYRQSERNEHYRVAADHLLNSGAAYRCYCTPEELEERRKAAQAERRTPGYDGRCRNLTPEEIDAFETEGREFSLRFKVPKGRTVTFEDVVRGRVSTETKQIPDFVILRSDGSPTYMLAATVDDVEMDITHIIRGDDLMAATPRQLLVREALGIEEIPVFGHLPQVVDDKGRPLSKRWGDVAVSAYREAGFLPEALVNYLVLLGWSYDDRTNIFSLDELVEKFSLERVGKNPAAFDVGKLEWLNGHYIRQKSPEEVAEALVPICVEAGLDADSEEGRKVLAEVAPLLTERMKRLTEAPPMVRFLFDDDVSPDEKAAKVLEGQSEYLRDVQTRLVALDKWTAPAIEETLRALAEERALKPKQAFQPIRAAVTGTLVSPPLFESLEILGRERTLRRLERVS
jgi:glutamyl-tRNA synthetase